MQRTVMVSGCFDLLHSGHVEFLQSAAALGRLYVAVGSDRTIAELKGAPPTCSEEERLFLVRALRCVHEAFISKGSGLLDFEAEFRALRPGAFVVNEDGDHPAKRALCAELGTEYVVWQRRPAAGLPRRSSTELRSSSRIPYRIDLAGGWLDQPFVSQLHPGAVVVASLRPDERFRERSGLATSTRKTAISLWGDRLPPGDPKALARILFACENPPGTEDISGSQDALGISLPGISRLHYRGEYWPDEIESIVDEETLRWLESHLWLLPLEPRSHDCDVLAVQNLSISAASRLAAATDTCWEAIREQDLKRLADSLSEAFLAQIEMFPGMMTPRIREAIDRLPQSVLAVKLAGAGGGGFLACVCGEPIPGAISVRIRKCDESN